MNQPNDFHLTGDEDTITIEIKCELMPITPEMRNRPRFRPSGDRPPDAARPAPGDKPAADTPPGSR